MMKSILGSALLGITLLFVVSSCATVTTESVAPAPGEVRLLGIDFTEVRVIRANFLYPVIIKFEADSRPEITRACFYWSGDGPYCFKVAEVNYGWGTIKIDLPIPSSISSRSYTLESFVIYNKDGRSQRTNKVGTRIYVTN